MPAWPQTPSKPRGNVVGLAWLCAGLRRIVPSLRRRAVLNGMLEHLGSLPLTAHSSLALVRLHNETLLLGITPQSITLLSKGNDESIFAADPTNREAVALREESLAQTEGSDR